MRTILFTLLAGALLWIRAPDGSPERPGAADDVELKNHRFIVVVLRDLPQGEKVQQDDLEQRQVPAQWVTSSYVKPEERQYVVGQELALPLLAGDPVQWTAFDVQTRYGTRCLEAMRSGETAEAQVSRHRQAVLTP